MAPSSSEQTSQLSEVIYLSSKLENVQIPDGLREKIELKLKRLRRMARQGQSAEEYESVAKYIDWCLSIPWGRYVPDNLDLYNVPAVMDSMHYGSEDVKEVVMEYLAVLRRKTELQDNSYNAPVLAFVGVQGAGKTSLAKAIAGALGRPFFRLPLGALGDSKELRGSSSTLLDGTPGQIIKAIAQTKCMNPIILLDEFDKVSGDDSARKDFMAIMLEILDPSQNSSFTDKYVDYPIDLSKIMFIATANRFNTISRELLDRLEFIEFPDYTVSEKTQIAKAYLFPKVLKYAGLRPEELVVNDDAWPLLIDSFAKDQGVRRLEQNLRKMARIVVKNIVLGKYQSVTITPQNVSQFTQFVLPNVDDIRDKDFTMLNQNLPVSKIDNVELKSDVVQAPQQSQTMNERLNSNSSVQPQKPNLPSDLPSFISMNPPTPTNVLPTISAPTNPTTSPTSSILPMQQPTNQAPQTAANAPNYPVRASDSSETPLSQPLQTVVPSTAQLI